MINDDDNDNNNNFIILICIIIYSMVLASYIFWKKKIKNMIQNFFDRCELGLK